jgi:23S rRNA (guanosine2251-2'-O)-methyltransferase
LLLLLDQIVDVQNLGSLIRTALCAGAKGVVITRKRAAHPSPAVSKASAGALEHLPVARVANMTEAIKQLKNTGFWIVGLGGRSGRSLFEVDLTGPLALVIGGEQKGIRPLVRRHCDFLAAIPQQGPLDSLNASAAGAVALFEAVRQRRAARGHGRSRDPIVP